MIELPLWQVYSAVKILRVAVLPKVYFSTGNSRLGSITAALEIHLIIVACKRFVKKMKSGKADRRAGSAKGNPCFSNCCLFAAYLVKERFPRFLIDASLRQSVQSLGELGKEHRILQIQKDRLSDGTHQVWIYRHRGICCCIF